MSQTTILPAYVTIQQLPNGTTPTGGELVEVVQTSGGNLTSVQLTLSQIAAALPSALATVAGLSVLGVAGNASAVPSAITGTANQLLVVNNGGTGLAFGPINLSATAAYTGFLAGTAIATATIGTTQLFTASGLGVMALTTTSSAPFSVITGTTRQVLAVNPGGTTVAFAQPQGDQLKGTVTNDSASAGNVGEFVSAAVASTALSNNTVANLGSVSLSPGDWDLWGTLNFSPTATTSVTFMAIGISTSSSALPSGSPNVTALSVATTAEIVGGSVTLSVLPLRQSLTATTTFFILGFSSFSASSMVVNVGLMSARRAR